MHYKFKPKVRMQSNNAVAVVHAMVGMCKLCVCYLQALKWSTLQIEYSSVLHTENVARGGKLRVSKM